MLITILSMPLGPKLVRIASATAVTEIHVIYKEFLSNSLFDVNGTGINIANETNL